MTELRLAKIQREISPERKKIWVEPPANRMKPGGRVPVVYYLCRNGQLEHPHFMEVEVSSSQGLFLRDVISRLNFLRGIGMANLYSWSCKRSYKSGFVWHDLSEEDIIFPVNGGRDYVLKGSEILKLPPRERAGDGVDYIPSSERRRRNQSCSSIDFSSTEYTVYKSDSSSTSAAADASTQTDEGRRSRRRHPQQNVVENGKAEHPGNDREDNEIEIEISPPPSDSSEESLEALTKTDGRPAPPPNNGGGLSAADVKTTRLAGKSSVLTQLMCFRSFKDSGGLGNFLSQYRLGASHGGRRMKLEGSALKRSTSCHTNNCEL